MAVPTLARTALLDLEGARRHIHAERVLLRRRSGRLRGRAAGRGVRDRRGQRPHGRAARGRLASRERESVPAAGRRQRQPAGLRSGCCMQPGTMSDISLNSVDLATGLLAPNLSICLSLHPV